MSTSHITCQLEAGATLLYILSLSPILANFQLRGSIFGKGHPVTRAQHLPNQSIYFYKEFVLAFNVSTLSTNQQSSQRAVVFNPTCVSIYIHYTSMGKGIHCRRNIGQKIHLGLGTSLSADEMMVCVRMLTWLINSIIFIWPCAVVAMPHTTL